MARSAASATVAPGSRRLDGSCSWPRSDDGPFDDARADGVRCSNRQSSRSTSTHDLAGLASAALDRTFRSLARPMFADGDADIRVTRRIALRQSHAPRSRSADLILAYRAS